MKNQSNRIARLEEETPSHDVDYSLKTIRKWIKEMDQRYGKPVINREEQERRWRPLLELSNSMNKAK